jgi:DNA processing protein
LARNREQNRGFDPDAFDMFAAAPLPVAVLDDAQRMACLRLIRSENVGPVTFRALINHFGGAQVALEALPEVARQGGRRRPVRICPRDVAEAELTAASAVGAVPLFTIEPGYPALLAQVDVPPPLLYVKGRVELLNRPTIAIVGSRDASAAGHKVTRTLAAGLGAAGWVIASGLARGIDASAHMAAMETGTIGVLAGGIDIIYPPEHAELQGAIGLKGCLVTEQPPGFHPRGQDFPRRNRIISGLSQGTVVVEAARRSGTLITARFAGEQGRDVFAVPGHPLDPRAEGTNQLLKDGATLVTEVEDVLRALRPVVEGFTDKTVPAPDFPVAPAATPMPQPRLDQSERARILEALGAAPVAIDEVARATGLPIRAVQIVLMELSLANRIILHGGQLVSLSVGPPSPE